MLFSRNVSVGEIENFGPLSLGEFLALEFVCDSKSLSVL